MPKYIKHGKLEGRTCVYMWKRQSGKPTSPRLSTGKLCQTPHFPLSQWNSPWPDLAEIERDSSTRPIIEYDRQHLKIWRIYHIVSLMSFGFIWEPCKNHQNTWLLTRHERKEYSHLFTVTSALAKEFPKIRERHVRVHYHIPNYPNLWFVQAKYIPLSCATYF